MDNLTLSIEDMYEEVSKRANAEGLFSREEWNDTVEEVLEEKRGTIETDDEEDFQYILESLQERFEDFSEGISMM
ncbi:MAG: hypothetical protein V1738_00575 [Patescibacteria group bacterium]